MKIDVKLALVICVFCAFAVSSLAHRPDHVEGGNFSDSDNLHIEQNLTGAGTKNSLDVGVLQKISLHEDYACCVSALATVWSVPCDGSRVLPVPKLARDVGVGECLLDGEDSVTQVYFKNLYDTSEKSAAQIVEVELEPGARKLSHGQKVALNLTGAHLIPTAEGRLIPAAYLRHGQAAGGGIVKQLTVHEAPSESKFEVAMFYTLSGSLLAGSDFSEAEENNACHDATSCGVLVSSYEHWTDPYTSLDTRLLFHIFGSHVVNSRLYQAYFWLESDTLDKWIHYFWPMKPDDAKIEAIVEV